MHWLLAGGVAAGVAVLFLALPVFRLARLAPGAFGRAARPAAAVFVAAVAGVLGAIAFVPLPRHVVAEGVWCAPPRAGVRPHGWPRSGGRPGRPGQDATVLRLDNPETARLLRSCAEAASLAIEVRRARAAGAERIDAALERERAVAGQIAALEAERATASGQGARRHALGTRCAPNAAATPGCAATMRARSAPCWRGGRPRSRLILDQTDAPPLWRRWRRTPAPAIPLRLRGDSAARLSGRPAGPPIEARDALPSAALAAAAGGRIPARIDPSAPRARSSECSSCACCPRAAARRRCATARASKPASPCRLSRCPNRPGGACARRCRRRLAV